MRRWISILLLAVFGLPLALPALALGQDGDAGLPACCRRNGQHHCMMTMAERTKLVSHDPHCKAPLDKCPYSPGLTAPAQPDPLTTPPIAALTFGNLLSHPTGAVQTEARRRISRDRTNQKRGPPTKTIL